MRKTKIALVIILLLFSAVLADVYRATDCNMGVRSVDITTGLPVAGDTGITIKIRKDGGTFVDCCDSSITDAGYGWYVVTLDANETNTPSFFIDANSTTANLEFDSYLVFTSVKTDYVLASGSGFATAAEANQINNRVPASPAAVGSQMDLVSAPNSTAVTAIQSGLAKTGADGNDTLTTIDARIDAMDGNSITLEQIYNYLITLHGAGSWVH